MNIKVEITLNILLIIVSLISFIFMIKSIGVNIGITAIGLVICSASVLGLIYLNKE